MTDDAASYRRIPIEILNEGRLELIDELFAEDYVEHAAIPPGFPEGREAVRMFFVMLREAFPDLRYEVLQQYQDGDIHIGYIRGSGTMTGAFMGMEPTSKSATWEETHIGRMRDGRLVEHWAVLDQLKMLQDLGLAPAPPGA
ncbi:MAG: ester cyclase [Acidimicrobiia bacterium]